MKELGYEIDESFVENDFEDPVYLGEIEKTEKGKPIHIYFALMIIGAILIGYGYGYYENSIKEAENLVLLNDCSSKINAQQFIIQNLEDSRNTEILLRQKEINLTSKCWSDLTLAQYEISVLKGYNFTKPSLIKQLDQDRKDFKELNERYYELENKLGMRK